MGLVDGVSWRYRVHVKPHLLLHENPFYAVKRKYNNCRLIRKATPVNYVFADATNIGDKVSAKGVEFLFCEPGVETFAARAGLRSTARVFQWLETHRPNATVFIGGGGLIQECFVPFWELVLRTKLSFVLFGIGANELLPERKLPPVQLLRTLARRALAIHVRDKWTQELLEWGNGRPVSMGVCPSVNFLAHHYNSEPVPVRDSLLNVQHPVDIKMAGGNPQKICETLKAIAVELGLVYEETSHINEDLGSLVKKYQRARFVVSSRLHGCIFSYALRVPFLPVISDKKISAFLDAHTPEIASLEIDFCKGDIISKIQGLDRSFSAIYGKLFVSSLEKNVIAMDKIKENLEGVSRCQR